MAALRSILNPEEAETATEETAEAKEVNRPEEATAAPAEDNAKEAVANQEEAKVNAAEAKMEEDGINASETETKTAGTEEAAPLRPIPRRSRPMSMSLRQRRSMPLRNRLETMRRQLATIQ